MRSDGFAQRFTFQVDMDNLSISEGLSENQDTRMGSCGFNSKFEMCYHGMDSTFSSVPFVLTENNQ